MSEPNAPRPPRRSNADYRWNKAKMMAFLRALVPTLSVAEAARSVGMSRQSAYRLRARLGPEFGQLWDEGLAIGLSLRRTANAAAAGPGLPAQGDTGRAGGVTLGAQGDARRAQGDRPVPQGDTSARDRRPGFPGLAAGFAGPGRTR